MLCCGATSPQPTSTPAPQGIETLAFFLGKWQCSGSFPSTGKPISSTMHFDRDLNGAAIVKHHDDAPPFSYHAIEVWNFNATEGKFHNGVSDNYGGLRDFTTPGWQDGVLTWTSGPGVEPAQQFVYTRLTDTSMRVDWQASRDKTNYIVGDTLTCTKSG
jgi:hypothetical protein